MRVETTSSIWMFDEDSMIFTRIPKSEDPSHPTLSYSEIGQPEPFTEIERGMFYGGDRIRVMTNKGNCYTGEIKEVV